MRPHREHVCRLALVALALAATTSAAVASTPSLGAVRPTGAQRGSEAEITFSGARLGDAQEILWYQPGIQVLGIQKVDDNSVKAKLKIAPDARLGLYDFRVRTATGISELRTFTVGALPETSEVEPNNDFAAPQPIGLDVTVNGIAENEDIDYFVVDAKKGERLSAEVEGIRLGITQFDPYVAILDAKRFELATSDDAALVYQDAVASVVVPEDGKYIIAVRESAYAGNGACLYRLHVGRFPRPKALVPGGGPPGQSVELAWLGDAAGDKKQAVTLPATPENFTGLFAADDRGTAPYPNEFRLTPYGNVIEAEPNNDQNTATPATELPIAFNGVIGEAKDHDFFAFPAKKGQVFDIRVYARSLRSPLDPVLHIVRKGANYLAGNDDAIGPDSNIRFQAPEDGDYVLYLHDQLLKGGPTYAYRVEVVPVTPKLTMSVPNESVGRGTGTMAVAVPKGNRQAILVNASRADFGGDLKIAASNLPAGVAMKADVMSASIGQYPVVFEAPADAPVGGTLAVLSGEHVDPNVKVPSQFAHPHELVLGANNVQVWTRTVDKLAVVVTEEAPYSIEIVQPKVPLVRGGAMNLKVVAKRKEGFTAPISVYLPWNPPGIGSSGGVAIPEGQTEALIPMNAADNAELRTWKIVVNGASNGPTGPLLVSSQLADLTVAEKFLTLTYQNGTVEQGKETDFLVKVNKVTDFPGEATVTLIGLPNKVTTDVQKVTKDTTDLVFKVKTAPESPAGQHKNLFCQVVITQEGEPILHNLGYGELRVDVPIPPKADAPAPAPAAAPAPAPAAAPAKPLSRLEQLRKDAADRAKAKAQAPAPAPATAEAPK